MSVRLASFIIILLGCIWGSSYILIFLALKSFSSIQVAALRIIIASIVLLPWVLLYFVKTNKVKITSKQHFYLIISGLLGQAIPAFLFSFAGKYIPSALSGILTSLTPIFTMLIGFFMYSDKLTKQTIIGISIGFFGILTIFLPGLFQLNQSIPLWPALCALLATILYGLNINIIKHNLQTIPAMAKTAFPYFYMAIPYVFILVNTSLTKDQISLQNFNYSIGAVLILGVLGSAVSMILFNVVIKYTTAVIASTNTFVIPIMALVWGIGNNEKLTWNLYTGMFFILCSLGLLLFYKPKNS